MLDSKFCIPTSHEFWKVKLFAQIFKIEPFPESVQENKKKLKLL